LENSWHKSRKSQGGKDIFCVNLFKQEIMMKQKTAFFFSTVLSVFILTAIFGVLAFVKQPPAVANNVQEVISISAEQEAAYNQLIEEANQQLLEAQGVINTLQSSDVQASATLKDGEMISAEAASQNAIDVAQGNKVPISAAELVNFEGNTAYEVPFEGGNIYVDGISGQVVFNGTIIVVPADISSERAAQLAAAYMGNDKVYKVQQVLLNDEMSFRVKFENSDAVFLSLKGDILLVRLAGSAQTAENAAPSYQEHDEYEEDEHEEYDDD
jgi:uncharacterized membrane protein